MTKKIEPFAYLIGKVIGLKRNNYEAKQGVQYSLTLLVKGEKKRLNSVIPIVLFEKHIVKYNIKVGDFLQITGALQSSAKSPNLYVIAKRIMPLSEQDYDNIINNDEETNKIVSIGYVSKFPVSFRTPSGSDTYIKASISIEQNKNFSEGIPVLCKKTERNASVVTLGSRICVVGRLESTRIKNKKTSETKTNYEIFVSHVGRYNPE